MKYLLSKKNRNKSKKVEGICIPCMGSCMFSCYGGNVIDIG
jgi:hypothetical protein